MLEYLTYLVIAAVIIVAWGEFKAFRAARREKQLKASREWPCDPWF